MLFKNPMQSEQYSWAGVDFKDELLKWTEPNGNSVYQKHCIVKKNFFNEHNKR